MAALPLVLLPVGADDTALDACLHALDRGTAPGTRVWLIDDARAGPRGRALIENWLSHTALCADYSRRARPLGEARHLDEALRACGDADVAVLAPDTAPAPGWLGELARCLRSDPGIASATPWSNAGEAAAWPRLDAVTPLPADPAALAVAALRLAPRAPDLPAAVTHAVLLRGTAVRRVGGLDASSFRSAYAALVDLSLRLSAMGWRNVLCETAFVGRHAEAVPADGEQAALAARWPEWPARLAGFLMSDPLHGLRRRLAEELACVEAQQQPCLFDEAGANAETRELEVA